MHTIRILIYPIRIAKIKSLCHSQLVDRSLWVDGWQTGVIFNVMVRADPHQVARRGLNPTQTAECVSVITFE